MTADATADIQWIISCKRPPSVVTCETVGAWSGSMLENGDRGNLTPHRRSGDDVVAIVTADAPSMIAVAKERLKVIF